MTWNSPLKNLIFSTDIPIEKAPISVRKMIFRWNHRRESSVGIMQVGIMFWWILIFRRCGSEGKSGRRTKLSTEKLASDSQKLRRLHPARILKKQKKIPIFPSDFCRISIGIRLISSEIHRNSVAGGWNIRQNFWKKFMKKIGTFSQPKLQFTQNLHWKLTTTTRGTWIKLGNHHTWLH